MNISLLMEYYIFSTIFSITQSTRIALHVGKFYWKNVLAVTTLNFVHEKIIIHLEYIIKYDNSVMKIQFDREVLKHYSYLKNNCHYFSHIRRLLFIYDRTWLQESYLKIGRDTS